MHAYIHSYIHTDIHIYIYTHTYTHTCIYIYCIYVRILPTADGTLLWQSGHQKHCTDGTHDTFVDRRVVFHCHVWPAESISRNIHCMPFIFHYIPSNISSQSDPSHIPVIFRQHSTHHIPYHIHTQTLHVWYNHLPTRLGDLFRQMLVNIPMEDMRKLPHSINIPSIWPISYISIYFPYTSHILHFPDISKNFPYISHKIPIYFPNISKKTSSYALPLKKAPLQRRLAFSARTSWAVRSCDS